MGVTPHFDMRQVKINHMDISFYKELMYQKKKTNNQIYEKGSSGKKASATRHLIFLSTLEQGFFFYLLYSTYFCGEINTITNLIQSLVEGPPAANVR